MKSNGFRFNIVGLHFVALLGMLLLQGCATGTCPVEWLNWPYNTQAEEPFMVVPDDSYPAEPVEMAEPTDAILLPPDIYSSVPVEEEPIQVSEKIYVVQKGDTLSSVASMYGTSWKKLAEYNGLADPNKILPGQELRIPGDLEQISSPELYKSPEPTAVPGKSSKEPISQGSSYVIQKGDTLSGIASRSGVSVAEIKAANALTSHVIVAGKSLSIPKEGAVTITIPSEDPEPVVEPIKSIEPVAGSIVAIPEPAPIAEEVAPVATAADAPVYEHVLYPGETIEDVARQYASSAEDILWLNGISDPATLKPGMKLLVPIPE
jgi:LysM repeat protein